MTHVLILQGTAGRAAPRTLRLTQVVNSQSFGGVRLDYVSRRALNLTRVDNVSSFGAQVLNHVVVRTIAQVAVSNVNTFGATVLAALPFVAVNAETTALLAQFTGTYSTTAKRQIDTHITELKNAGVWSKLDYYVNFNWAINEHDSLLDWTHPTRSLAKVGGVTWTPGQGWTGASPTLSNSRLTSGWNIGDGPHSTGTSFCMFCKIDSIASPENGMQPMGVWRRVSGGGPTTPDGAFLSLSPPSNSGFAGGYLASGNGNSGFVVGDGLGLWGTSHNGSNNITVDDGSTVDLDAVSGTSTYTHADGVSICGSAGLAHRSFPGLIHYAGWGAALTAVEINAIEQAFQVALLPPSPDLVTNALIVEDAGDYLVVDDAGNYLQVI
jgi:hypothetical protein